MPPAYELPVAILLIAGGVVSCFAGYRLFKSVLAFFGFVIGAMFASSMMGVTSTVAMVAAALAGGLIGALTLVLAYFVGIAIVGAGLGAVVAHVGWPLVGTGEPPALAVILLAVAGACGAMFLQRYVIIVGTAFAGSMTILLGCIEVLATRTVQSTPAARPVWILYPMAVFDGPRWMPIVWALLGFAGTAVQLGVTGKKKKTAAKS
jgi:hypothetical protein